MTRRDYYIKKLYLLLEKAELIRDAYGITNSTAEKERLINLFDETMKEIDFLTWLLG